MKANFHNNINFEKKMLVDPAFCFDEAGKKGDWSLPVKLYKKILILGDPAKKLDFIAKAETFLEEHPEQRDCLIRSFAEADGDDDYLVLNCLRSAENGGDRKKAVQALDYFAHGSVKWNPYLSDVLFYAMREKINVMPYLLQIDRDDLRLFVGRIQKLHPEFTNVIADYFDTFSFENVKGLYWTVCLLERAVLAGNPEDSGPYLKLFESYARQCSQYVRSVFRPEMLSASNLSALPRACRFGYYMGAAYDARDRLDGAAYLAGLRAALREYPIMEKPISLLLNQFIKEQKLQQAKALEFSVLAGQVKQKIESLIEKGDMALAGRLTTQLSALLPNDEDVLRYQKLTHTEPTMAELASRIPQ